MALVVQKLENNLNFHKSQKYNSDFLYLKVFIQIQNNETFS